MPEGQFSGSRTTYEYISDAGTTYLLKLDTTLGGLAGTGLTVATTGTAGVNKPLNFKPRVVYWQGVLNGNVVRKSLVCSASSTLYESNVPVALTIDGVAGSTTGRRGEQLSFASLAAA